MELVNTTGAVVSVQLMEVDGLERQKAARVTAKLTFHVARSGALELVTEDPVPVLDEDVATAFGFLPRDLGGLVEDGVELIVNGVAHAPRGEPVTEMDVSLSVGESVHRVVVIGDRWWIGEGEDAQVSAPTPFVAMPLTWERAFGGTVEVWIDAASPVGVPHPPNPSGRGMDPAPAAARLVEQLGAPEGYPRFERARALPNLEDPRARVERWADAPLPHCWSTRPMEAGGAVDLEALVSGSDTTAELAPAMEPSARDEVLRAMQLRCHPELSFPRGALEGAAIAIEGMSRDGRFDVRFPAAMVALDYSIDGRAGTRALALRRVVLLPEERRVAATYETKFRFHATVDGERSARLRVGSV